MRGLTKILVTAGDLVEVDAGFAGWDEEFGAGFCADALETGGVVTFILSVEECVRMTSMLTSRVLALLGSRVEVAADIATLVKKTIVVVLAALRSSAACEGSESGELGVQHDG